MKDSAVAPLLKEYEQFRTEVEPTLAALPESYRGVILAHHEGVVNKLREHLGRAAGGPVEVEGDPLVIDVVLAVDAPEGEAELLMLVLPVSEAVYGEWAARDEDLQTHLAARVVQAVYESCGKLGLVGVQAMFGGHRDLLAVEVELGAIKPDDVKAVLQERLEAVLGSASELQAAKVQAVPRFVAVDHLLPPEEDDEDMAEVSSAG